MASTCWGLDNTAPDEVIEGLRAHLEKHAPGREHVDGHLCCLLADLGGKPCPEGGCGYHDSGKKLANYTPHKPVRKKAPAGRRGPRRRRPARPLALATPRRRRPRGS